MNNTKKINYYVWNDEPISASYYDLIQFENGQVHTKIGEITINKGDIVSQTFGSSRMEYTRSGKGYVAEFPYGKICLFGVPAFVVLDNAKELSFLSTTQEEFQQLVDKQKERLLSNFNIDEMINTRKIEYLAKIEKDNETRKLNEKRNKEQVSKALEKMNSFFNKT